MRTQDEKDPNNNVDLMPGLHSFGEAHAEVIQTALADEAPGWVVERHYSYDGYLIIIITLKGRFEAPAYVLSGTKEGIQLASVLGDVWQASACVDRLAVAIDLLRRRLKAIPCAAQSYHKLEQLSGTSTSTMKLRIASVNNHSATS